MLSRLWPRIRPKTETTVAAKIQKPASRVTRQEQPNRVPVLRGEKWRRMEPEGEWRRKLDECEASLRRLCGQARAEGSSERLWDVGAMAVRIELELLEGPPGPPRAEVRWADAPDPLRRPRVSGGVPPRRGRLLPVGGRRSTRPPGTAHRRADALGKVEPGRRLRMRRSRRRRDDRPGTAFMFRRGWEQATAIRGREPPTPRRVSPSRACSSCRTRDNARTPPTRPCRP